MSRKLINALNLHGDLEAFKAEADEILRVVRIRELAVQMITKKI